MSQSNNEKRKFNDLHKQIQRKSYVKECFHCDGQCSSSIISAHSIQNNRILNKMSDNGEVLCFSTNQEEGDVIFLQSPVGRRKATTFTGFCGTHDTKIFSPIEVSDYAKGNKEQEFLFAYRALAKEYHSKKQATKYVQSARENISHCDPTLEMYLEGSKYTLSQLERDRQLFNTALDNRKFDIIKTRVIIFYEEYHVAVSSAFTMEKDMNGNVVNDYLNFNVDLKFFYLTIFPQNGKTFVLFSCLKKNVNILNATINSIAKLKVIDRKVFISNLIAAHVENVVLSPIRWNQMAESQKLAFQSLFNETILVAGETLVRPQNINLFI
jgi:hypothetical protein